MFDDEIINLLNLFVDKMYPKTYQIIYLGRKPKTVLYFIKKIITC